MKCADRPSGDGALARVLAGRRSRSFKKRQSSTVASPCPRAPYAKCLDCSASPWFRIQERKGPVVHFRIKGIQNLVKNAVLAREHSERSHRHAETLRLTYRRRQQQWN